VQLHAEARDVIGEIDRPLDRGRVDPVLHVRGLERGALQDRLTDDPVLPADEAAGRIEPGAQTVHIERPIAAAREVVLAGPDQLHRLPPSDGLGDAGGLAGHVPVRGGPPAETPAREQGVDLDLLRR
jgi:hypothetical protein